MTYEQSETAVANFIQKSFQILENKEYEKIIQWAPNGKEFAIKDIEEFEQSILPKYFRHRNINSFIRQLNMYGFHKSRKEPTKNIFSHGNFLKGHPELLHLVKRKIKADEKLEEPPSIEPQPSKPIRKPMESQQKMEIEKKPEEPQTAVKREREAILIPTKAQIAPSFFSIPYKSFNFQVDHSPLKSLMSKSYIMDMNPDVYLKMRSNKDCHDEDRFQADDDDLLSIDDEIEKERRVFQNRMSGISILQTHNLLSDI